MASTVWKGFLTFGLVSVPVRVHAAARSKAIHFNRLHRRRTPEPEAQFDWPETPETGERSNVLPISRGRPEVSSAPTNSPELSRVTQEFRAAGEENPISPANLVQGYEYARNRYVVVEKTEIADLTPKTSATMDLQRFVKLSEMDPIFFEKSYYVVPEGGGEKPYALLFKAMQRTGYCGLASVAMHRRQHVIILRSDQERILAHTMYYLDEIKESPHFAIESSSVSEKELRLAEAFINALAGPFQPELFCDEYRSGLESLIAGKVRGDEGIPSAPIPINTKPTIDIMEALKASIERVQGAKRQPKRVAPEPTGTSKNKVPAVTGRKV